MKTTTNNLLVAILAKVDAVFQPLRTWEGKLPAVLHERRWDYLAGHGIPWHATGADEAERKKHQRLLGDLADAGLITIIRSKAKTMRVALTDRGDETARRLAGCAGWQFGLASLAEIARRMDQQGFTVRGTRWLPEIALAGVEYGDAGFGGEIALTEELAGAALARGWIESNSDIQGRVSYHITKLGENVLRSSPLPPECDGVEACPELIRLYERWLDTEKTALAGLSPKIPMEIGSMPLPASVEQRELEDAIQEVASSEDR